jgi:hypothetical protein
MILLLYLIFEFGFMICIWQLPWLPFIGAIAFCCGMEYIREWWGKMRRFD